LRRSFTRLRSHELRRGRLAIPLCSELKSTLEKAKGVNLMDGRNRADIKPGMEVDIVLKADQRTGKLTRGIVKDILTKSANHPHGIKVRLADGRVGRVKAIHASRRS